MWLQTISMNTYLLSQFLKYISTARHKRGHGIHSPFVYDLIRTVFIDTQNYTEYDVIEQARQELLHNNQRITVADLGAGSKTTQRAERTIADIAAKSLSPKKYAQLLFRLVKYSNAQKIVELGTSLGVSGTYLALANPAATCISLEGDATIASIAKNTSYSCGCTNLEIRVGNFSDTLPTVLYELAKIDFAYIDGNHTKEATLAYFEKVLPACHEKTILVFDDISWSKEMTEAWETIELDSRTSITINLGKLGIVFFNKGIVKQNFTIRY